MPSSCDRDARRRPARLLDARRQPQAAAVGHRAQAVGREVPDDLLDLPLVGVVPELVGAARRRRSRGRRCTSALLRSSSAVSLQRAAHVEARDRRTAAAARRRGTSGSSSFSRSDSRSTMSISCSCSLAERQLLAQDLDRARHRRERVADLVRDAGRHLADRRQPLLHARVALELLDVGDVLERERGTRRGRPASRGASTLSPMSMSPRPSAVGSGTRRAARAASSSPRSSAATSCAGSCSTSATARPTTAAERARR